ncbi:carbohydrate ABC transporter permease [Tenggerimyces flavus]|uniref:Carbohydrate ABC transporter permease n=1 Tax=Tenggerimyces flavus TaxID=1708749 RepID=A0ABV7Y5K7_9ACTN|nr:sugar ABC transporter permease [Tenggerimyces flavus]MBM7790975.1 multiple sugar transport system permease protein/cellobiose transport system permease protein [Tenggerimyces flavus]
MTAATATTTTPAARAVKTRRFRQHRTFYLMVSPFFVLFGIFGLLPIIAAIWIGLTDWDGLNPAKFVGLANYATILTDPLFAKAVGNTIFIWIGSTVITCGLAFVLAYLINEYVLVGGGTLRMVFLLPMLAAPAVIAIIMSVLFSTNAGLMNAALSVLTGDRVTFDWLASTGWIKPIVIVMITWRFLGFHLLLFVAGLQSVPRELYDAARVDGANGRQVFWRVTVPLMLPIIFFSATSSTVGAFQLFDEPFVLTNGSGGTDQAAEVMGTMLFRTAFTEFEFGTASALSWIMFALIAVFTIVNSRLLRVRT